MNKQYMDIIPPNFKWFKTNNGYNGVRIKVEGAWPSQCSWGDCVRPVYRDGVCYFAWQALNFKLGFPEPGIIQNIPIPLDSVLRTDAHHPNNKLTRSK